jgi:hypothetical protein
MSFTVLSSMLLHFVVLTSTLKMFLGNAGNHLPHYISIFTVDIYPGGFVASMVS